MRPSPATVIALIALIAALSGSAYAALSRNSIGTKQLKKSAVRTSDIRNNAVTGKKAKESSFGQVPSANTANTADTANSATSFGGMTAVPIAPFTLTNGGSQPVVSHGPFTLTATCTINQGGVDTAAVEITTSQNNSAFAGEQEPGDFDIGDTFPYVEAVVATPNPEFQEDSGAAIAPDGSEILGHQLYAGVNIFGQPGVCRFGGVLFLG